MKIWPLGALAALLTVSACNTLSESYSNGYDIGQVHYLTPGENRYIGYVYAPADFRVDTRIWDPDVNGNC